MGVTELFDSLRWREFLLILVSVTFVLGYVIVLWIDEQRAVDARVRALEVGQAQLWCNVDPKRCK